MNNGHHHAAAADSRPLTAWAWHRTHRRPPVWTARPRAALSGPVLMHGRSDAAGVQADWRTQLATLAHRQLARRICALFFDPMTIERAVGAARQKNASILQPATSLPTFGCEIATSQSRAEREVAGMARRLREMLPQREGGNASAQPADRPGGTSSISAKAA